MKRLAVLLSVSALLVVAGCSGGDDDQQARPEPTSVSPTPSTPTASDSPTPEETADPDAPAIDYATSEDSGTTVSDPAAAGNLPQAPADFKTFLSGELDRLQNEAGDECNGNKPEIRVSKLQAAGWASGGVFTPECGGYSVLWAKTGSEWSQVWGGQELVDCTTLTRYRFPASVAGDSCLGQNGTQYDYPS